MATPAKIPDQNLPVVALVGRVNVGKSTLFNRLIEERKALVSPIPGTTRTNNEGLILWRKKLIKLVDTGGLTFNQDIPLEKEIINQTKKAIADSDAIIFVTDAKDGILPQEKQLAEILRKVKDKPVILIANKVDKTQMENNLHAPEWHRLGLGEAFPVSAANGRNVGNFLDHLHDILKKTKTRPKIIKNKKEEIISVAIIGKPNAGKSSLFNKLIGQDKVITNEMPHTTREPHDTLVTYSEKINGKDKEFKIKFVDTAGIRRKANVSGSLEQQGIMKSIESIEKSDIIIFVVDGSEPISSQDRQLGGLLEKRAKSVMLVINKWDLSDDNSDMKRNEVKKMVYGQFPHIDFAPLIFVSSLTGYRTHDIFPLLTKIWTARHTEIPVKTLEYFLKGVTKKHLPSRDKGVRHPELLGMRQINTNPPVFEVFVKARTSLHISYVRYLENELRSQFDFFGTPIIIRLSKMKR